MPAGTDDGGGNTGATARPPALPPQRPIWMVVLSSLMLVVAFQLFLGGLSGLRGPPSGASAVGAPLPPATGEAAEELLRRSLAAALERADPALVRGYAASKLALALLLLYAVAAIGMNDRRGRAGVLVAASAGIAYHVGSALYFVFVVREGMLATAPQWVAEILALQGAGQADTAQKSELYRWADTFLLVVPIGLSLLGVVFSAVLIRFFGGRPGRAFYGLPARAPRPQAPLGS